MKNKKGLEVDSSLSLSFKTCLEKFLFWSDTLNLETGKEMTKAAKYSISQERKELLRGNKNHF